MTQLSFVPETPLTVSQVARAAGRSVEGALGQVWVRGEIAEFKKYQSGHWYFTLKDAESQVRSVMWRTNAIRAGTPPDVGAQVFVLARPTIWEERGEFRLTVSELLVTDRLGLQHQELERVKAALHKDGLFDPARKRPLPQLPTVIAVVTSLDGAALRDIITVTHERWPGFELRVIGTKVQGYGAEDEVIRALSLVDRLDGVDLCILARGGGGKEDLAVFNREAVCRALARVRVPTISAVGHETDVSLSDLVADVRAPTPSAAAQLAVPHRADLTERVDGLAIRLANALGKGARVAVERLERTADRLQMAVAQVLERRQQQLAQLGAQLDALSPLRVLERGFALPRGSDGQILRTRAEFLPEMPFRLRVRDGEVPARVEGQG
jgi:exodeoxyribonuclease VII large subunit